jgi:uncharacterized protein
MNKDTQDFYIRLEKELKNATLWPSVYLFKFILPSNKNNINIIEKSFDNMGAVIKTSVSKTGKFTSVSITVNMVSAESVIAKYQELSTIEGIISL